MYRRIVTQDGVTVMNKELYDNLQDGIDELKSGQFLNAMGRNHILGENSKKGGLLLNKLFGKSTQITTEGNQLLESTLVSGSVYGGTYTVNTNKSIAVSGTFTDVAYLTLGALELKQGTTYKVMGYAKDGINVSLRDTSQTTVYVAVDSDSGVEYTPTSDMIVFVVLRIEKGVFFNTTVYPSVYLASVTNYVYEPFTGCAPSPNPLFPQEVKNVGSDHVTTFVHGTNLLELVPNTSNTGALNGLNVTIEKEKMGVSGKATAVWANLTGYSNIYFPSGTYVLSIEDTYDFTVGMKCKNEFGRVLSSNKIFKGKKSVTFTVNEPFVMGEVFVESLTSGKIYSFNLKIHVTLKDTLPYAPFTTPQTLVTPIPYSLKGIKTNDSTVANFTDESGQMWICDEIDFERGVYVQRIKELVLTGNEAWEISDNSQYFVLSLGGFGSVVNDVQKCNYLFGTSMFSGSNTGIHVFNSSTHGEAQLNLRYSTEITTLSELKNEFAEKYANGTPVKVYYAITTPIETSIGIEDVERALSLKSYDGVITIIGSENLGISVEIPTTDGAGIAGYAFNLARQIEHKHPLKVINTVVNDILVIE